MRPVLSPSSPTSLFNAASVYTEADSRPVLYPKWARSPSLPDGLRNLQMYVCVYACVFREV